MVFGVFVLFALLIVARVFNIGVLEGEKWREKGGKHMKWVELEPERGDVFDCRGNLLATSLPFFEVRMDLLSPSDKDFKENIDSLAICLAKNVGKQKASEWKAELVNNRSQGKRGLKRGTKFHFIAKGVPLEKMELMEEFPLYRLGKHKGGLIKLRENKRFHPYQSLAHRTIGVDRENADKIGLEASYDKVLKGDVEEMLMEKIGPGLWVPVVDPSELSGKRGGDIVTTLNIDMQDVVHHALEAGLKENKASSGCAILMDVRTGAIKSMANLGVGRDSVYSETYNYAVAQRTEPGSTFKLATSLMLMDHGYVNQDTKVDLHGGVKKFYDLTMYDSNIHGKRDVSFGEVFYNSSNVGMGIMAQHHYGKKSEWNKFYDDLSALGVIDKTEVDLLGEPAPKFKHPVENRKEWYGTTVPWVAHGYESMMTPLQILNLYNAVANDGRLMKPYLVESILQNSKVSKTFRPRALRESIASPTTIQQMQNMLDLVVTEGTGRQLKSNIVQIAGKTGTTRVNYADKDRPKEYNASFAGYFPADNPKYSLIVCVYSPKNGKYYGGAVTGPVFKKIAERIMAIDQDLMQDEKHLVSRETIKADYAGYADDYEEVLAYIGVNPKKKTNSRWVEVMPDEMGVRMDKKKIYNKKIPNVQGMGLRDATYVLENLGVRVSSFGAGKVYKQSLAPGTKIENNEIQIYLR